MLHPMTVLIELIYECLTHLYYMCNLLLDRSLLKGSDIKVDI